MLWMRAITSTLNGSSEMTTYTAIVGLLFVVLAAPQSKLQPSAADLVAGVRSADMRTKAGAARAISDRADLHNDPAVKAAVLAELRQANEVMKRRHSTQTTIGSEDGFEYADVYLGLVQAAQRFEGEDVLVALIPTLGNSASARVRVASFGVTAIEPLITAYNEPYGLTDLAAQRLALLDTLSDRSASQRAGINSAKASSVGCAGSEVE
jgi:hypothetical protein